MATNDRKSAERASGGTMSEPTPPNELVDVKKLTLAELLEKARHYVMTDEEREAQRQSWARGEMALAEYERGMTTMFKPIESTDTPATDDWDALRLRVEELDNVLADWNALVAAIGSPTNGAAVGHAKQLVRRVEELTHERDQARRDWEHTDHMLKRSEEARIAAERELREARQARWIPVSEKLPELDENQYPKTVLFMVVGRSSPEMGWWSYDGPTPDSPKRWNSVESAPFDEPISFEMDQVTHWMPLPEPPAATNS